MRWFLEEQLDNGGFQKIKEYVLSIKDMSETDLIDEIIRQWQSYPDRPYTKNEEWILDTRRRYAEKDDRIGLIADAMETRFYLLDDDYEHHSNVRCVANIIEGKPVVDRYTNKEYR